MYLYNLNFLLLVFLSICLVCIFILIFYIRKYYFRQIYNIVDLLSSINYSLDIDKILPQIMDKIMIILNPKKASLMLIDDKGGLKIKIARNISNYIIRGLELKPDKGVAGKAISLGKPILVKDISKSEHYYKIFKEDIKPLKKESLISIPIKFLDKNLGVLNLHFKTRSKFPKTKIEEIMLKIISQQLAGVINNCYIYLEAVSDKMTKFYNHHYIIKRLQEEIYYAQKYSLHLSLIMFDIDYFKNINDRYGHQAGDTVIMTVADITRENVRLTDILGRYGGEEFCIILPNTTLQEASNVAERLRKKIEENKIYTLNETIKVTCSFGVTEFNYKESMDEFLYRTDKLLYTAKNLGRNTVCL